MNNQYGGGNRPSNKVTFLPRRRKFVHRLLSFRDPLVFGSFVYLDLAVAASGIDQRLIGWQSREAFRGSMSSSRICHGVFVEPWSIFRWCLMQLAVYALVVYRGSLATLAPCQQFFGVPPNLWRHTPWPCAKCKLASLRQGSLKPVLGPWAHLGHPLD